MDAIGQRMLEFRARNDLTQEELAKMCRVSKQTIWMIEKYDTNITPLTRKKIELIINGEEE